MRFLFDDGWRVVALEKLVENLQAKEPLFEKTIALTFDDGFQNFYASAFPILKEYSFPATVFLVTDFCGKSNDWAGNPPDLPRSPLLSWNEIKELSNHGIEFGAHTRTHPDLTKISRAEIKNEIAGSKKIIENATGAQVKNFAYPYGRFNRDSYAAAEENFDAACSVSLGKASPASDCFALERVDAYYLKNPKLFRFLATGGFDRYLSFRRLLRRVKSLAQTN